MMASSFIWMCVRGLYLVLITRFFTFLSIVCVVKSRHHENCGIGMRLSLKNVSWLMFVAKIAENRGYHIMKQSQKVEVFRFPFTLWFPMLFANFLIWKNHFLRSTLHSWTTWFPEWCWWFFSDRWCVMMTAADDTFHWLLCVVSSPWFSTHVSGSN